MIVQFTTNSVLFGPGHIASEDSSPWAQLSARWGFELGPSEALFSCLVEGCVVMDWWCVVNM